MRLPVHCCKWMSPNRMRREIFWKEDTSKNFQSMRSEHWFEEEAPVYSETSVSTVVNVVLPWNSSCRRQMASRNVQPLFRSSLYHVLVRRSVNDDLIDELGIKKQETYSVWPRTPGLKCFDNDDVSLIKMAICWALLVGKTLCSANLEKSPNWWQCGDHG